MSDEPVTVIQLTDSHLFDDPEGTLHGVNTRHSLDAVVTAIQQRCPQAVLALATGDLTHDSQGPAYGAFAACCARLGSPVWCLPGNHDDADRMAARLASGLVQAGGWVAVGDHWQLILLDSTLAGEPAGRLGAAELARLERQLAEHPDRYALIALHHQPVAIGSPWMDAMGLANGEALFAVLERHPQVRGVLWGHNHQAFDATREHWRLLATPATSVQFKPQSATFALDDRPPGWRWLRLAADGRLDTGVERLSGWAVIP